MINENLKKKIKELPNSAGVYIMRNDKNEVIYVGKAKVLKNRVSQYFTHKQMHPKVQAMVENVCDFEYVIVPSELDAFILENSLIKKYQPFFNILLKDGKQYPYIKISLKEKFPKFSVVRKIKNDGSKYFGPYFGSVKADEILKTINYAYPIRTCNLKFKEGKKEKRECLNYSLGLCSAPCTGRIDENAYNKLVKNSMNFLQGDEKEVLKILKNKMNIASESENFEVALGLRDRIKMVEKLASHVVVDMAKEESVDVISMASNGISFCVNVLIVRHGKILGGKNFNVLNFENDLAKTLESFVVNYYSQEILIPKKICLNLKVDENLILEFFEKVKQTKVQVLFPQKGAFKKLSVMSEKNAEDFLQKSLSEEKKKENETIGAMKQLQKDLGLKSMPLRIECYDISHISGTLKVGSMVVFENGSPAKTMYRKFKIKTVEGNNDFESLKEVLTRRINEFNKAEDVSFSKKPSLFVIDGGKGQLSSVFEILSGSSLADVDLISLAKREEEVFVPHQSESIVLSRRNLGLRLLQNIRDEAHRFAITFHRSLRTKNQTKSEFDGIKGIGKVLKERLYQCFTSAENVRGKTVEELMQVQGISKEKAISILKQLNSWKTPCNWRFFVI